MRRSWFLVLCAIGLTACGAGDSDEPGGGASDGDLGARVYADACASCHGADMEGTDEGPSFLSIVYEPNHHTDDSFRSAVARGAPQHHFNFGDMQPIEGLTEADVEAVIAFVRAEQERLGFRS